MATLTKTEMNVHHDRELSRLSENDRFIHRHIGPTPDEIQSMLATVGCQTLDELIESTVPAEILSSAGLQKVPAPTTEPDVLLKLKSYAASNQIFRSFIGAGYYGTHVPAAIARNVLENPGWYTAYTPYQAEISQGRLESLLNFQQMVMDLTGMEIANASLLDEATAAAEAMALCKRASKLQSNRFFVADDVHPQSIDVVKTRAKYLGFEIVQGPANEFPEQEVFGALIQYPSTTGGITDISDWIEMAHDRQALVVVACDLLSLTVLKPPGEFGADVAIGNSQRFGVPMGLGGPHAAFFATRDDFKRSLPGRIIGVSKDARGNTALRMAMQTREQHIRRDKATSNICTAQALLANMAAFYAVYHGPEGLKTIAQRTHYLTRMLARGLKKSGFALLHDHFFDTIAIQVEDPSEILILAAAEQMNFRMLENGIGISLDETTTAQDVSDILSVFGADAGGPLDDDDDLGIPQTLLRQSEFLQHPVFHRYRSETELLRYMKVLENKDYSLVHGMIPLGSCTMKLNAATEMLPVSWPEFANIHPFSPPQQWVGYQQMIQELEQWLAELSGYDAVCMQPNSGAQGEYAGLLAIRRYQESVGQGHRDVCLIPSSAHGTNPASASMMGLKVVVVKTDENGNIDMDDLQQKIDAHADRLSSLMITYPSTHGVFEATVRAACEAVHQAGGQVYMDGANMNALVGISSPGWIGSDVSHMNLHKTFCIPHGGGGPGMGPIGVKKHLAPFVPNHRYDVHPAGREIAAVSASPYGSAAILPISWAYIHLMGGAGLRKATQVAILNANYIAKRLDGAYPVLYRGQNDRVAHECIVDIRPIKETSGVTEEDIAKRMMDYGFHAPTMSWPVPGTIMIEPTESESKAELDRFCDALLAIREEIRQVERGEMELEQSPLKHAPHTIHDLLDENWDRPYSRQLAVSPVAGQSNRKYWPAVNRVDNVYGDRNFVCSCPPVSDYEVTAEN